LKILYVCHRFPYPPAHGGKIRAFNTIRHLSASGHQVTVASLARSAQEAREGEGIRPYCERYEIARVRDLIQMLRMIARIPTITPSSMGYFYSPTLARQVRSIVEHQHFDLIFVHCSSVAHYVSGVHGVPKILDFADMDSQKWLNYARYKPFPLSAGYRLEGLKLQREEKRLARMFDLCTAITPAEWETLESFGTGVANDWFPNGVDSEYFAPSNEPYDENTLCFVGRMDYYPNQECMFAFCANVLPRIQARRPKTKLLIIGAEPSAAVKRLAQLPGVTVTGSVPDVRPDLQRSALMIAPLNIARGTQNKILEAMACGIPVVTSAVAAGGVDAVAEEHFLVARNIDDYAAAVLRVLEVPKERARLAAAGRSRVLSHHSWGHSMRRLDRIIDRCLASYQPSTGLPESCARRRFVSGLVKHSQIMLAPYVVLKGEPATRPIASERNLAVLPDWVPAPGNYIDIGVNTLADVGGSQPVIDNWNSAIYADDVGAYGAILLWGAGHCNLDNGVYQFSFDVHAKNCRWSTLKARSAPSAITNNGAGDPETAAFLDGSPAPVHTHDQMFYIPASVMKNAQGSLGQARLTAAGCTHRVYGNWTWFFDIAAKAWSMSKNAIPAEAIGTRYPGFGSAVFDPRRGCVWFTDSSGSARHIGKLDIASGKWTSIGHYNRSYNVAHSLVGGYCPQHDVVVWWYSSGGKPPGKLIIWDPEAQVLTWDAKYAGVPPLGPIGLQWCPHPNVQKFYGRHIREENILRTLTPPTSLPGTWMWGSEQFKPQGGARSPGNGSHNPRYSALRWASPLRSFVWPGTRTGPINVFRPAGAR
jgi:sugar transferase (PEP-CTERM/EpsH1 system associated)